MAKDIFGSQSGSPFSPQTGQTGSWLGRSFFGGDELQTSLPGPNRQVSASHNSEQCEEQQTYVQDVVLDSISSASEVVLVLEFVIYTLTCSF